MATFIDLNNRTELQDLEHQKIYLENELEKVNQRLSEIKPNKKATAQKPKGKTK